MTRPLVSVIVPTRGRPLLLREALDSLAAQHATDWECLVVVDGGGASDVIERSDPRFRIITRYVSGGPGSARNTGLQHARGEFVAFLDDDDLLTPSRLACALQQIGTSQLHVIGLNYLDGFDGPRVKPSELLNRPTRLRGLGPAPSLGQCLIRRSHCPSLRTELRTSEDVDWWLRVGTSVSITGTDEIGYQVRRHDTPRPGVGETTRLESRMQLLRLNDSLLSRSRRLHAYHVDRVATEALRIGDHRLALKYSISSLMLYPSKLAANVAARSAMKATTQKLRHG